MITLTDLIRVLHDALQDIFLDYFGTVTPHYLAPTALGVGGTATIWTPAAGKAIKLTRIQISVSAATRIDLIWAAAGSIPAANMESYYLPINGSVVANFVGCREQGVAGHPLALLSSAAATVTAKASGVEV